MLCRSSLARTLLKVMRLVLALPPRLTPQCPCCVQRVSSSPGAAVTVSLTVLWFSDQLPLIRWGPARCRSSSPHFPGMRNEHVGVAGDVTWTASSIVVIWFGQGWVRPAVAVTNDRALTLKFRSICCWVNYFLEATSLDQSYESEAASIFEDVMASILDFSLLQKQVRPAGLVWTYITPIATSIRY